MITLDTSAILALANARDPHHERCVRSLAEAGEPYFVPAGTLAEVAYLIETRLGPRALEAFVAHLASGAFTYDCGERDFARISELVQRYADLSLGFADAAVIACAERNGGRVLTLDLRDFGVVAREGTVEVVPGPASR